MKKFGKLIKWILVIIVIFLGILIILPYAFKGKITQIAKEEINKNVNAQVDFGDISLSFFSSFPNLSVKINDIHVVGLNEFEGDTLATLSQFRLVIDLMSVLDNPLVIKSIVIEQPHIFAKVLATEKANWDIGKENDIPVENSENEESSPMVLSLSKFKINNGKIIYQDLSLNILTTIKDLNFSLSGDLTSDFSSIKTESQIAEFSVTMDGIEYLHKTKVDLRADINADLVNSKYTFIENTLSINDVELGFDGSVTMPQDDINIDMSFQSKKTDFKSLLSLIPAVFMNDFQNVKTSGSFSINGFVKGVYNEKQLPAFDLKLLVDQAKLQYPDLPSSLEDIAMNLQISNPDGIEDHTIIDLKAFHMNMAGNPFGMKMLILTPISDPNIDGNIQGKIDLGKWKDIIPLEDTKMSGLIEADITMKGKMSSIEKEDYQAFKAVGNFSLENLNYVDKDFPKGILISNAKAILSPQFINVEAFQAHIGQSDLSLNGKIENILAYYFKDELLKAEFYFASNNLDMNDLMGNDSTSSNNNISENSEEMSVIEIPKNIDFCLNCQIDQLLYDQLNIANLKGQLVLREGVVSMKNVNMQMLDGNLKMNGNYSSQDIEKPSFDMLLEAENFDVQKSFIAFNTIKKLAPIAKHTQGKISAKMDLKGVLLPNMEPDLATVNGNGRLQSNDLKLNNSDLFQQIGGLLKTDKFNQLSMNNIDASFKIENGQLSLKPFETKFGKSSMTIGGTQYLDETIDYHIDFAVPSSEFGSKANDVANQLFSEAGKFGVDLKTPENIKFKALVGGKLTDPKVSLDLKSQAANMVDDLKKQAEEKLRQEAEKAKQQAIDEAKKQAAILMAEAEKQGKALIAEAQKIATQAKNTANKNADLAKDEAYKQADNLLKEAGNDPLKKIVAKKAADKIKSEADTTATKVKSEAAKKADEGVKEAEKQAAKLKSTAQKEGDEIIAKAQKG